MVALFHKEFRIITLLTIATFVTSCQKQGGGTSTSVPDQSTANGNELTWVVGHDSTKLDSPLEAIATHEIDGGGTIDIEATCENVEAGSAITLEFQYYSKDYKPKDDSSSYYDTDGKGFVAVPYRIDGGGIQTAVNKIQFKNAASVTFAYFPEDYLSSIGGWIRSLLVRQALESGALGELQAFLHAREVDFQLPLGGGITEIVKVNPQDGQFQNFISQCAIDVAKIDAAVAKKRADEKIAQDQKAQQEADEAARKEADEAARNAARAALGEVEGERPEADNANNAM